MRLLLCLAAALTTLAATAHATCNDDINKALPMARALPDPRGRAAVLENIERARATWHDGDEDGCKEQMHEVLDLLQRPTPPTK